VLRVDVENVLPLEEAASGLDMLANGGTRGKIVITVGSSAPN
jgi:hypothetical protein